MAADLMRAVGEVMAEVQNFGNAAQITGESTALWALNSASVKSLPYIGSDHPAPSMVIGSRSYFLEAGLISLASWVHNFVMALIYGIAALIQMGQDAQTNTLAKRSILHVGISSVGMALGLVGIFSPEYGSRGTLRLFAAIFENRAGITEFLA